MSQMTTDNRYMEFRIGTQLYAIPLLSVKEVITKPEVTLVPNSPPHFEGLINLRGQILGIYNAQKKLGLKPKDLTKTTSDVVIIIEDVGAIVGVVVDEVTKVLHADPNMISAAPLKEDDPNKNYVSAIIQTPDDLVMVLKLDALLELNKLKKITPAA